MKTQITAILTVLAIIAFGTERTHAIDTTLSIAPIANSDYVYPSDFLFGTVTLGGVTFDLPSSRIDWESNPGSLAPDLSATLSLNIPFASSVRLLLNTGNTYTSQMSIGDHIGDIGGKVIVFGMRQPGTAAAAGNVGADDAVAIRQRLCQ